MESLMQLYLVEFKENEVLGIYGPDKNRLAARMRYLHPTAAKSFVKMNLEHSVRCSDMFRTPEGSLMNRQNNGGKGLRPGWSGHNYGFSIDIDVKWMLDSMQLDKVGLDEWVASHGWYCHNPPGTTRAHEAWHYNYFGEEADFYLSLRDSSPSTWDDSVAAKIDTYYSHWWENADNKDVQLALREAKVYNGDIDGDDGELTKTAIKAFQRAWDLTVDGIAGPVTKRTLMLVAAEKVFMPEPC